MDVFLGSKIINAAEGEASKRTKAKLEKALLNAIEKLEATGNKLSYMKGSASFVDVKDCLLYTSPSPRDRTRSRMPSSA